MTYVYKFYPAGLGTVNKQPKDEYTDLAQETVNDQFYNSSDWWPIQEETSQGSGVYQNVDARIVDAIDATTTDKIQDDWKKLLFQNLQHPTGLGWMYSFNDNYWITTNVDSI